MGVINTIDLTGVSADSWNHAAQEALKEASRTIRKINKIDIISTSGSVEEGVITEYHTEVRIFFEIES
ncbi:MAG TPA: dodecin family protein [Actinomycetota bacterium]|nr:dodecin family protein [Actinomycetota bacterium]